MSGLVDQQITTTPASTIMYLSDSGAFKANWKIEKTISKRLLPGREMKCTSVSKSFHYDPSDFDSHALIFQPSFQAQVFLVRVQGILVHDTVADEQGFGDSGVDTILSCKWVWRYDAGGVTLDDYSVIEGLQEPSTLAVATQQPLADNQVFSAT